MKLDRRQSPNILSEIIEIEKMGPEGIILVNPPITTFQQNLTHSAMMTDMTMKIINVMMAVINIMMMTTNHDD